MPIPTQAELYFPLLRALANAGGEAKPSDLYDQLAHLFPDMTEDERAEELKAGHNVFNNRVQWVRQRLVNDGHLDGSTRGIWRLTESGREILSQNVEPVQANGHLPKPNQPTITSSLSNQPSLSQLVNRHEAEVRSEVLQRLTSVDPTRFEQISGELLRALGFRDVVVTAHSSDGGIDGHGKLRLGIVTINAAFQSKRWAQSVGRPAVDAFRGATQGKFEQAVFLTTSTFTEGARAESVRPGCIPIVMLDGTAIVDLMLQHGVGVRLRPLTLANIDEEFFAPPAE